MNRFQSLILISVILISSSCKMNSKKAIVADADTSFSISKLHPRYLQYKGIPVFPAGISVNFSNIIQPKLFCESIARRDIHYLVVNLNMADSSIDKPYQVINTKFNLDSFSSNYWNRLNTLLSYSSKNKIMLQLNLFLVSDVTINSWANNPFNPKNNSNILKLNSSDFYNTIELSDSITFNYQKQFVQKIAEVVKPYDNIICQLLTDVPTDATLQLGEKLAQAFKDISKAVPLSMNYKFMTIYDEQFMSLMNASGSFSFLDISANVSAENQEYNDNFGFAYHFISDKPRPVIVTSLPYLNERNTLIQSCQSLFAGAASVSIFPVFYDMNASDKVQNVLKTLKSFLTEYDVFSGIPDTQSKLLKERDDNEAYLHYIKDEQYAVFFPASGEVKLDLTEIKGKFILRSLDISKGIWSESIVVKGKQLVLITGKCDGGSIVLLSKK